jgi:D-erythrulose 4-kinase
VLVAAGDAWAAKAGGTSGVLWGAALRSFGDQLPDDRPAEGADLASGAEAALAAVRRLGRAEPGDKTLIDALQPFTTELRAAIEGGGTEAWRRAAQVATKAAADTADLRPRTGRARPLAERSVGTPDPGATSLALALTRIGELLGEREEAA